MRATASPARPLRAPVRPGPSSPAHPPRTPHRDSPRIHARRDAPVCPIGTYSLAGASSCTSCPSGSSSLAGASSCTCTPGFAVSGSGASLSCTGPSPSFVPMRSSRVELTLPCFFGRGPSPPACVAGTYSPTGTPCARTSIDLALVPRRRARPLARSGANPFKTLCSHPTPSPNAFAACGAGSYSGASASICLTCPSFSSSASGAATCACNAGYQVAGFGASLVCTGPFRSRSRTGSIVRLELIHAQRALHPSAWTRCSVCLRLVRRGRRLLPDLPDRKRDVRIRRHQLRLPGRLRKQRLWIIASMHRLRTRPPY